MSQTLSASLLMGLTVSLTDTGNPLNTLIVKLISGNGGFAKLDKSLVNGSAANQATKAWYQERTVTGTSNDDIDLTSLTDRQGAALSFASVAWLIIRIPTVSAGQHLLLQPGPANGWTAWFGGTTPTEDCRELVIKVNATDFWTVDGTHKVLRVNNPTGSSIIYDIVVIGS